MSHTNKPQEKPTEKEQQQMAKKPKRKSVLYHVNEEEADLELKEYLSKNGHGVRMA